VLDVFVIPIVEEARVGRAGFGGLVRDGFHVLFIEDQFFFTLGGRLFRWRRRQEREGVGTDRECGEAGQDSSHAHLWRGRVEVVWAGYAGAKIASTVVRFEGRVRLWITAVSAEAIPQGGGGPV